MKLTFEIIEILDRYECKTCQTTARTRCSKICDARWTGQDVKLLVTHPIERITFTGTIDLSAFK